VTLTARGRTLAIRNRDAAGGDSLYFRFDGQAATIAGDDSHFLAPGQSITIDSAPGFVAVISLISAGTPDYSVEQY
jgi:hypothetical protein